MNPHQEFGYTPPTKPDYTIEHEGVEYVIEVSDPGKPQRRGPTVSWPVCPEEPAQWKVIVIDGNSEKEWWPNGAPLSNELEEALHALITDEVRG